MRRYEWDTDKARINLDKHGVSFDEAQTVLEDPLARYLKMLRIREAKSGLLLWAGHVINESVWWYIQSKTS